MTRDLVTSNNTVSISNRPRLLAAGPIQNAEKMKSLLTIDYKLFGIIFLSLTKAKSLDSHR